MIRKKLAILFSGTGSNFAYIVKYLHHQGFEIAVAITNNPKAKGIAIANAHNIPLEIIDSKAFTSREDFDKVLVERLQNYAPDLTILAGFMRILTPHFTENIKSINLHPSLLPRHKGLHAIERSYEDEHAFGGVSVHWVSSELDAGNIILQKEISKEGLNFEAYYETVRVVEKEVLVEAIREVLNKI
jgi:phosphoribosylglycinamide formyltransferase-1